MHLPAPPTLRTARLTLRAFGHADAADLYAIYADPAVARYGAHPPWTALDQAHAKIDQILDDYRSGSGLRLAVVLDGDGPVIGAVSVHHFEPDSRRCELGYALASAHWGRGYAGEAVAALVDYAFDVLDMNRLEADIDPRNAASARVLERLGFQREGYLPERWIVNGETADTVFYGLLRRYRDGDRAPLVGPADR